MTMRSVLSQRSWILLLSGLAATVFILGCSSADEPDSSASAATQVPDVSNPEGLERVTQTLVAPPFLPAHQQVATGDPKIVQVRLEIEEKLIEVDSSGAEIWALTFNGSVPGPMIVVHQTTTSS